MSLFNESAPRYTRNRAEAILSQALPNIHPACIQEFLYPPQDTHLQQLQQVLMQPRHQTVYMSVNTLSASDSPSFNEMVRCVIFPSFLIGPLSAMYHISEHVKSNFSPYKTPYISRSVRDDQNGIYAVFADLDTGFTELDIMVSHSPAFREHVTVILNTTSLRAVMNSLAKRGVYEERMMRDALIFTSHITQIRPCPFCARSYDVCGCPLNLIKKQYPVDFTTDLANLASYAGDYEGLCQHAMHEGGVNLCTWMSRVGVTGRLLCDDDGTRKLESWAMWNTLQGRENLFKLAMPDSDNGEQPSEYFDEGDRNAGVSPDEIAEEGDVFTQSFLQDIGAQSGVDIAQYMAENVSQDELLALGTSEVPAVLQYDSAPSHAGSSAIFYRNHAYDQSSTYQGPGIPSLNNAPSAEVQQSTQSIDRNEQSQMPQLSSAIIVSTAQPVQQPQLVTIDNDPSITVDKDAIVKPKRTGRPRASSVRGVKRLLRIVPAMKTTNAGCENNDVKPDYDEATRKREIHKAQNRESAFRSHERKKKRIQALKDSLAEAKKLEEVLRQEVEELEEENLALRASLED